MVRDACNPVPLPTNLNMPRRIKILSFLLSTLLLATCGGGGSASTPVTPVTPVTPLTLSLPARSISASQLAVIVAAGDPLSEEIARYYQTARGIPATNIIRVALTTGVDTISVTDFAALKAELEAKLPSTVQATLLTWTAPSRVVGSCAMRDRRAHV